MVFLMKVEGKDVRILFFLFFLEKKVVFGF